MLSKKKEKKREKNQHTRQHDLMHDKLNRYNLVPQITAEVNYIHGCNKVKINPKHIKELYCLQNFE